ncbi:hypothetical protein SAMN05444342_3256 [Haladaptatus paucihalophilus DX253]|uniref:Uncharacterized protein n=1 Tax=Haladaptatus paucihalophilus DX253 TaxID=797209 RepID=A0A1M6YQG6_HALPU|nr:hypothetical protein SAMN05444342_3256 [Haladaptatus paucihalophilus DX253]
MRVGPRAGESLNCDFGCDGGYFEARNRSNRHEPGSEKDDYRCQFSERLMVFVWV